MVLLASCMVFPVLYFWSTIVERRNGNRPVKDSHWPKGHKLRSVQTVYTTVIYNGIIVLNNINTIQAEICVIVPKKANSKNSTLQKNAHSKNSTFQKQHIPNRAHFKKSSGVMGAHIKKEQDEREVIFISNLAFYFVSTFPT